MARDAEPEFVAGSGDTLIDQPRRIAKGARQGVFRHDPGTDLVCDEDHRRRLRGQGLGQGVYGCAPVLFGQHKVGQPERQAIDQPGRRAICVPQGAQQIANSPLRDAVVSVFILPPSIAALEARLKGRAQDSDEVIAGRMKKSRDEISHWAEYGYVLVNADLDECAAEVAAILKAERLRRDRRTGLAGFVGGLNREFEERMG